MGNLSINDCGPHRGVQLPGSSPWRAACTGAKRVTRNGWSLWGIIRDAELRAGRGTVPDEFAGIKGGLARGAAGALSVKRGELRAQGALFMAFDREQPEFRRGAAIRGKAADPAAGRDHPMARHDDRERISCESLPNPRRQPVPRERHRSSSRPAEFYARPRRRGGGMAARGPCPAEWMKDHPALHANTRRYCPARALARMAGAPLSRVEIAEARERGSSARWPREAAGKRSRVRPTRSRIGQSPYRRA